MYTIRNNTIDNNTNISQAYIIYYAFFIVYFIYLYIANTFNFSKLKMYAFINIQKYLIIVIIIQ